MNGNHYSNFLESSKKSLEDLVPERQRFVAFELSGQELIDTAEDDADFLDLFDRVDELGYVNFVKKVNRNTFRLRVDGTGQPSQSYFVTVKIPALDDELSGFSIGDIEDFGDSELENIVKDVVEESLMEQDIRLLGTCPSFKYHGFDYLLYNFDARYKGPSQASTIPPDETNPNSVRFLCKHTYRALKALENNEDGILDEIVEGVMRSLRAGTFRDAT